MEHEDAMQRASALAGAVEKALAAIPAGKLRLDVSACADAPKPDGSRDISICIRRFPRDDGIDIMALLPVAEAGADPAKTSAIALARFRTELGSLIFAAEESGDTKRATKLRKLDAAAAG